MPQKSWRPNAQDARNQARYDYLSMDIDGATP